MVDTPVRTIAVTGAASGIGGATAARLVAAGHRVVGIDLKVGDAEVSEWVEADLGTRSGRADAIARVTEHAGDGLDGLVTAAGLAGLPTRPASVLVSVNEQSSPVHDDVNEATGGTFVGGGGGGGPPITSSTAASTLIRPLP